MLNGVFTFPVAFNNVFSYAAVKGPDHGGGIPNVISVTETKMNVELEWITWGNGISHQNTSNHSSAIHLIAVGN